MQTKRPSRACFACKAKKVKVSPGSHDVSFVASEPLFCGSDREKSNWGIQCDETNPNPCQRCLKSGMPCVYRPESDIVFRDMTIIAKTRVCKRVNALIAERAGSPQSPGPSTSSRPVKPDTSTTQLTIPQTIICQPGICPPMSTVWREVALPQFFADFVFESTVFTGSGLSFLRELYGRADQHAPLKEALNAVASLSMANQHRIEPLKLEALQSYFHAIQLMAKLLQHPDEAQQDATLATNYLFGLFEVMLPSCFTVKETLTPIVCTLSSRAMVHWSNNLQTSVFQPKVKQSTNKTLP
jgi:Fungal Zn(2)-Cys(6) binuclear cluster domain